MLEVVFSQSARGSLRVSDVDSIGEVFCFELALDVGDIAPERFWDKRETVLRELIAAPENKRAWGEEHAAGCVADAQDALERLLDLAGHDGVHLDGRPRVHMRRVLARRQVARRAAEAGGVHCHAARLHGSR